MNDSPISRMIQSLSGSCALILGDLILDEYLWGDTTRISPEAPVPVLEVASRTHSLGGALNVAANVVGLGGSVIIGGVLGCDQPAEIVRQKLSNLSADGRGIVTDPSRPTTTKTRLVARGQQVVRMDCESRRPIANDLELELISWVDAHLAEVDVCVLSDYGKGVVTEHVARHVIDRAAQLGRPVVVDPKGDDYRRYRGATVVKPNLAEAEAALRIPMHDDAGLLAGGARLTELFPETAWLITCGDRGMYLFRAGLAAQYQPARARSVADVTGAGDTVIATIAVAVAAGLALDDAVVAANLAAGVVVTKRGTAAVTDRELLDEAARLQSAASVIDPDAPHFDPSSGACMRDPV